MIKEIKLKHIFMIPILVYFIPTIIIMFFVDLFEKIGNITIFKL